MTTLIDYARVHFPNHAIDASPTNLTLTEHAAVAHVLGAANSEELVARTHEAFPDLPVGVVLLRPTDQTIAREGGEDPDGVVDLPHRRVATAGVAGAAVAGGVVGVIVGTATQSVIVGVIVGVFAAILGGTVAATAGGGSRYGGERAWEQPHAPDRTIAVVAAFTENEHEAVAVARAMEALDPYEVRIVSSDGAWHSPNT
ncbi:MAG: hypothetical protein JWN99_1778 [Ilumatobacteraceae bacterium]|nr:hypothetical protein [Ilumatobacteraceae bacterium]